MRQSSAILVQLGILLFTQKIATNLRSLLGIPKKVSAKFHGEVALLQVNLRNDNLIFLKFPHLFKQMKQKKEL